MPVPLQKAGGVVGAETHFLPCSNFEPDGPNLRDGRVNFDPLL
jgi:hypothetical protein